MIIMNMVQFRTPFLCFLLFSLIINSAFVQCVHDHHHQYFTNSSRVLSLPLHPNSSILKHHHHNYTALTQSRLASDIARLNSINSKLQYYATHSNLSGHSMANTVDIQPDNLRTALFPGDASYLVRIGVGRPEKESYMVIDTGSGLTWLQCQPCTACFKQHDPIFNPFKSSSFAALSCSSRQCAALPVEIGDCIPHQCIFNVIYGDKFYSTGILATETLSFGRSGAVKGVAIGCGLFSDGSLGGAAGVMGLSGGLESLSSQINASSFSYCLVDMDSKSYSTLEFNSAPPNDSIIVPMLRNPKINTGFFYVGLTGISVGGVLLSIPASIFEMHKNGNGGVILDSGSTATVLPAQAYDALTIALSNYTIGIPRTDGFASLDTCYNITSAESYARFPVVGFVFSNGKTLSLNPKNYLRAVNSRGKFCVYFAKSWVPVPISIIGNTQQQGMRITFDLANKWIGFSPNKC